MTTASGGAVGWHEEIAESFSQGYQRSAGFIERHAVWSRLIDAHVGPGDHVLDAGCGAGTFSLIAAARAKSVSAFDGSAAMIAICERARGSVSNVSFEVAMLDSLDRASPACFDVVLSSSVLEYADDLPTELARLARVLKPGGKLIVSMPNAGSLYRKLERVAFRLTGRPRYYLHVRNVPTVASMTTRLGAAGLEAIETIYFADPPTVAARLMSRGERDKTLFVIVARKR